MRTAQSVEGEHGQRGRAIYQDEVVVVAHGAQGLLEPLFTPLNVHQFDLSPGQFAVGAQDVIAATGGRQFVTFDPRLGHGCRLQQHIVDR